MTKRLRRKPVTRTVRPHHEAPKEPRPETHDEAVASRNEIAQSLAKFIAKFGVLGALAVSVSAIFTVMLTLWGFAASWDSKASKSSLDDIAKIVVRLRSDVDAIKKDRETERQENRQDFRDIQDNQVKLMIAVGVQPVHMPSPSPTMAKPYHSTSATPAHKG